MILACQRSASFISRSPAITIGSLLASAICFEARMAASSGANPTAPVTALSTMSASFREAISARPSTPGGSSFTPRGTQVLNSFQAA